MSFKDELDNYDYDSILLIKYSHLLTIFVQNWIKKFWVKDGAIVPGQVELSGLFTLVRASYPH